MRSAVMLHLTRKNFTVLRKKNSGRKKVSDQEILLKNLPTSLPLCLIAIVFVFLLMCSAADRRINDAIPVTAPAFFDFYQRAFFKAGEPKHSCHKLFLLVIASRHPQYVTAICSFAQQQVAEIVIAILQKAIVSKRALSSWEVNQILWLDFPADRQISVCKWAERLTKGKCDWFFLFCAACGLDVEILFWWSCCGFCVLWFTLALRFTCRRNLTG